MPRINALGQSVSSDPGCNPGAGKFSLLPCIEKSANIGGQTLQLYRPRSIVSERDSHRQHGSYTHVA